MSMRSVRISENSGSGDDRGLNRAGMCRSGLQSSPASLVAALT
jgi:hypothetical protein